ncbi:MAG: PDZ domain-containing protein [Planctomycetes bacterium]|nr:PDZ domain-containing protein [Planctomycetota bacterium]
MYRILSPLLLLCCICLFSTIHAADSTAARKKAWLGITIGPQIGMNADVVIESVKAKSTAAEMGLKVNDVITQFANEEKTWDIRENSDLSSALRTQYAGDKIRISIKRDSKSLTLSGVLKAKANLPDVKIDTKSIADGIKKLDTLSGTDSSAALIIVLHELNQTLEGLPEKIEEAAQQFKKIYPDGEFTFKVEISISSKADKDEDADDKDTDNDIENKEGDTTADADKMDIDKSDKNKEQADENEEDKSNKKKSRSKSKR